MPGFNAFTPLAKIRMLNGTVKRFMLVWALVAFAYFGLMGVLLNLYLLRIGFEIEFIGLLIASGQVIWAILALPAGSVGKRFGLRNAIALGHILTGTGIGLLLLIELLPQSWWTAWVFASWALVWVGAALNTVNATPYMMYASSPEERNLAFATQSAVLALSGFLGGIVAGWLPYLFAGIAGIGVDEAAAYRHSLWLVPLFFLAGSLLMLRNTPLHVVDGQTSSSRRIFPLGLFVLLGSVVVLQATSEGLVRAFFNIYLDADLNIPTAQIGIIIGIGQLLPVWAALQAPMLLERWGSARTLAITSLLLCASLVVLALLQSWLGAALGFTAIISLTAISGVARNLFSQELVPASLRTTTSAILTIGLGLGWAAAAGIGGYVVEAIGFGGLFSTSAILPLAAAMILFVYLQRNPAPVTP